MTRPEDIPADVWDIAGRMMIGAYDTTRDLDEHRVRIARALIAYGQSRADEATERAARVCEACMDAHDPPFAEWAANCVRSQK